jgi:mRNA interferase MazF
MTDMLRGRIYRAHLSDISADKLFLVVSNNRRNRASEQVLAVRLIATPPRDDRPAMVPLGPEEVMTGWVSCDDIETMYDDEVRADAGALRHRRCAASRRARARPSACSVNRAARLPDQRPGISGGAHSARATPGARTGAASAVPDASQTSGTDPRSPAAHAASPSEDRHAAVRRRGHPGSSARRPRSASPVP